MSPRVPTAFRPLESEHGIRRAATSVPSFLSSYDDPYATERLELLSRLEQRWCPARPFTCSESISKTENTASSHYGSDGYAAPVPRRSFVLNGNGSSSTLVSPTGSVRQSMSSPVDEDAACLELRGIFGHCSSGDSVNRPLSRSSSATLSQNGGIMAAVTTGQSGARSSVSSMDHHDMGFFPLEEIVVSSGSPISRSGNPMPLDAGFGAVY